MTCLSCTTGTHCDVEDDRFDISCSTPAFEGDLLFTAISEVNAMPKNIYIFPL